jgi:urocanate hydratase
MIQNNLDSEVAEHAEELIVYGGTGKAVRNPEAYRAILRTPQTLSNTETLLEQSSKSLGCSEHMKKLQEC